MTTVWISPRLPAASRGEQPQPRRHAGPGSRPGALEDLRPADDVAPSLHERAQHLQAARRDGQHVAIEERHRAAHLQRSCGSGDRAGLPGLEVAHQRAHERAEPPALRHQWVDATVHQRPCSHWPDGGGDDAPEAKRASSGSITPAVPAAFEPACAPGADVNTTASISPPAAARTEFASAPGSGAVPTGRRRGWRCPHRLPRARCRGRPPRLRGAGRRCADRRRRR